MRRVGLLLASFVALLWGLATIIFEPALHLPNPVLLWTKFGEGPFVLQSLVLAGWFIASTRRIPARHSELLFLSSLPIANFRIFLQIFLADLARFSWVPLTMIISLLALIKASSLIFLTRPTLLYLLTYLLAVSAMTYGQLLLTAMKRTNHEFYALRWHPGIQVALLLLFDAALIYIILLSQSSSALFFGILIASLLASATLLFFAGFQVFDKLQRRAFWLSGTSAVFKRKTRVLTRRLLTHFPLLAKNLILRFNSNSRFIAIVLTIGLAATIYTFAMNNSNLHNSISVALGLYVFFIAGYCFAVLNTMKPDIESPQIIFGLPLRRCDIFLATFIPSLAWAIVVSLGLATLLAMSGATAAQSAAFVLRATFASICLIGIASATAVTTYPKRNKAQKNMFFRILAIALLGAAFYKYLVVVIILLTALAMLPLLRFTLWQES